MKFQKLTLSCKCSRPSCYFAAVLLDFVKAPHASCLGVTWEGVLQSATAHFSCESIVRTNNDLEETQLVMLVMYDVHPGSLGPLTRSSLWFEFDPLHARLRRQDWGLVSIEVEAIVVTCWEWGLFCHSCVAEAPT